MITFQTALNKVKYLDSEFGWDYDILLFESGIYKELWKAMMEFDFHEPSRNIRFANMRSIKDGEILIDEEMFDASVYAINEEGDVVG